MRPGTSGTAHLQASGDLTGGSPLDIEVTGAEPSAFGILFVGIAMLPYPTPFKGGLLGPDPVVSVALTTSPAGGWLISGTMPVAVPAGTELYLQYWYQDLGVFAGAASTNTVGGVTPSRRRGGRPRPALECGPLPRPKGRF